MMRILLLVMLLSAAPALLAAAPASPAWREKLAETMPLLGHRNWILIVDSAYPLQSSPGVETIETNQPQLEVVRTVLHAIESSIQVRPDIYMDAELPFVPDDDAPGASEYRREIGDLLHNHEVARLPHEQIIHEVDQAGQEFHVLVLKTTMTIPYTSVFVRLDCKYWSADAEKRMREKMSAAGQKR